jgi:dihydrofolate reductase
MIVKAIVAVEASGGIGKDGKIPWPRIKEDMRHFREVTMGKAVIMGRKTWQSIGKTLPGRKIIVLTSSYEGDIGLPQDSVWVARTPELALEMASQWSEEVIIAGGEHVYHEYSKRIDVVDLTVLSNRYECDRWLGLGFYDFSDRKGQVTYDRDRWDMMSREFAKDADTGIEMCRFVLRRKK